MKNILNKFISIILTINLLLQPLGPTLVYAVQSIDDSSGLTTEEPPPPESQPTCTTDTFVGECAFSGDNWCRIGQSCTATSPTVSVSCPIGQKINNIGTYCTYPDGRKSFSGRSECVPDSSCPQPCETKKIADCVRRECDPGIQKMVCIDRWQINNGDTCDIEDRPGIATDQRCGIPEGQDATAPTSLETCFRQECDQTANVMVCIDKWNICEPEGCTETEKPGRLFGQSCVTSAPGATTQPADTPAEPAPIITYRGGPFCSLEAIPQTIQVGGDITWRINADPPGISANWIGPDLNQPARVEGYPEGNLPNWLSRPYTYNQPASYTRQAVINYSQAPACTTNSMTVTITAPPVGAAAQPPSTPPSEPDINLDFNSSNPVSIINQESQTLASSGSPAPPEQPTQPQSPIITDQTSQDQAEQADVGAAFRRAKENAELLAEARAANEGDQDNPTKAISSAAGNVGNVGLGAAQAVGGAAGNLFTGIGQLFQPQDQKQAKEALAKAETAYVPPPPSEEEQETQLKDGLKKKYNLPPNATDDQIVAAIKATNQFPGIKVEGDTPNNLTVSVKTECFDENSANYSSEQCIKLREAASIAGETPECLNEQRPEFNTSSCKDTRDRIDTIAGIAKFWVNWKTNGLVDIDSVEKSKDLREIRRELMTLRQEAGLSQRGILGEGRDQYRDQYGQLLQYGWANGLNIYDAVSTQLLAELQLDKQTFPNISPEEQAKRDEYEKRLRSEYIPKESEAGRSFLIVVATTALAGPIGEGVGTIAGGGAKLVAPVASRIASAPVIGGIIQAAGKVGGAVLDAVSPVLQVGKKIVDNPVGRFILKPWDISPGGTTRVAEKETAQEAARLNQIRVSVEKQLVEDLAENPNAYPDEFIHNTLITEGKYTDEEAKAALERIKRKAEEIRSPQTKVEETVPEAAPVQVLPEFTRAQSLDELFQILREAKEIRVGDKIYTSDQLELIIIRLQNAKDIQQINNLLEQLPNVGQLRTTTRRLLIQEGGQRPAQAAQVTAEQTVPPGDNIFNQAGAAARKGWDDTVGRLFKREPEIPLQPSYVGSVQLTPETIDETVNLLVESFRNTPGASKESLTSWVAAYYKDEALSPEQLDEIATKALRTLAEKKAHVPGVTANTHHGVADNVGRAGQDVIDVAPEFGGRQDSILIGVYDGHGEGGAQAAAIASRNMREDLLTFLGSGWDEPQALSATFVVADREIATAGVRDGGASTAVALINGNELYIANAGDARVVLSSNGRASRLSVDHDITSPNEVQRVINSGGTVEKEYFGTRKGGSALQVSRSLGDYDFKQFSIPNPTVGFRRLSDKDEFMIVASDGLWGRMSDQEAVDTVRAWLAQGYDLDRISQGLAGLVRQRGETDDITVAVVLLKQVTGIPIGYSVRQPIATDIINYAKPGRLNILPHTSAFLDSNVDFWQWLLGDLVKPAFALEEKASTVADSRSFEFAVKRELLKRRLIETKSLDSKYVSAIAEENLLLPLTVTTADGYLFVTGKNGSSEWAAEPGKYRIEIASIPGVDIKVPGVVDVQTDQKTVIPVAITKGTGKVEKATTLTGWQWLLNKLFGTVFAQEKKESQVQLMVFSDTNNNGRIDKDEQVLPWAGLKVELKKVNQDRILPLIPGWNLVSLEVLPSKPLNASTFLQEIAKQGGYATTVSTLENGAWKSFVVRGDKTYSGDDFPITAGKAYFVKALKSSVLVYQGQELVAPIKLNLASGWNSVGVPYSAKLYQAADFIDTLNTKGGGADTASRWESGLWDTFVKQQDQRYGENFMIEQGRGYLLKVAKGLEFSP